jgi:hypothetical protein
MKVSTEGSGVKKYWGVSQIKGWTKPKRFEDANGNFNEFAWEKAMQERTELMLEGKPDPLVNFHTGYYTSYAYLLGKIRHLGTAKIVSRAARFHDSALFHLWGFFNRPNPKRFNLRTAEEYANCPPELLPVVKALRLKLIEELKREGTDPALHDFNYAQSLCQPTIVSNS